MADPGPPDVLAPPPDVAITPCDPWPRPYYLEDNLRRVHPYHFTYNTYCKERWRNREILGIFADEFRDRPIEYYRKALLDGAIVVNGKHVDSPNQLIRNGEVVSHTMHRHEPPVTAEPIGVIHEDEDLIVINKPAGVPVHPAGRYNYNSVVEILRAQRGHSFNPLPCNRLDRLTSGIMFIGKHKAAAEKMTVQLTGRTVKKEYVARVVGKFPDGDVVCEQPILQISPKLGLNRVRANGKPARTVFRRLAYYPPEAAGSDDSGQDGSAAADPGSSDSTNGGPTASHPADLPWRKKEGHSIIRCRPLTGRTHQLRVHLQFLGHPISNDPIYSNQRVFGSDLGCGDSSAENDEDIIARLSRMGKDEVADAVAYHDDMVTQYQRKKAEKMTGELCGVCATELYSDPGVHELGIYLHARRYEDAEGRWGYETGLPKWALPPEGMEGPTELDMTTDPLVLELEGAEDVAGARKSVPAVQDGDIAHEVNGQ